MFYRLMRIFNMFSNRGLSIIILLAFFAFWFYYYNNIYLKNKIEESQLQESSTWALVEEIKLVEIEENISNTWSSVKDKIDSLKEKLDYYIYFDFENISFNFKEIENWLELYVWDKKVLNFDLYPKENINVKTIYSSNSFLLKIAKDYYIYELDNNNLLKMNIFVDIIYAKKYNDKYILVTDKWSYVYNKKSSSIEYFSFFHDFVYYKNYYIWIIKNTDTIRLNNLWLDLNTNNSIYFYNPLTKEKKSLYDTNISLEKIYYSGSDIYFEDSSWKKYKLENFK